MMLFDTTIRRELARSFGATLIVLLTIVLTLGLVRTVGAAAQGKVSAQDVLLLLGYTGIGQIAPLLSLSMFIAVVYTLGRIWRDSEMVIWNSSGIQLSRFVRPVFRMAWLVCVAVTVLVFFVTPWVNRQASELTQRYSQRSDLSRVTPGVFQVSRDGRSVFFIERERDNDAQARSVFIHSQGDDRESLTVAKTGQIEMREDGRFLMLTQGHRVDRISATGESVHASFDQAQVRVGEAARPQRTEHPPKTVSTLELLATPSPAARGELAWRFGLVLASFNLLLLGIGLSVRNPRKPSQWGVVLALLSFVVYFNLINLSQSWVATQRMGLVGATLVLHGSVAALGCAMLAWRDLALGWRIVSWLKPVRRKAAT